MCCSSHEREDTGVLLLEREDALLSEREDVLLLEREAALLAESGRAAAVDRGGLGVAVWLCRSVTAEMWWPLVPKIAQHGAVLDSRIAFFYLATLAV